jgi:hypothetical protein
MAWLLITQFNFKETGLQDQSGFDTQINLFNGAALNNEGLAIDRLGSCAQIRNLPLPFTGLKVEVEFKMNPLQISGLPIGRQNIIGGFESFNIYSSASGKYYTNFLTEDMVWNASYVVNGQVVPNEWQKITASCDGEGLVRIKLNEGQSWAVNTAKKSVHNMPKDKGILLGAWPSDIKHYRAGGIYRSLNIYAHIPDEVLDRMHGRSTKDKKGNRKPMDIKQVKQVNKALNKIHNYSNATAEMKSHITSPGFKLLWSELAKQDWHSGFRTGRGAALIGMLKSGRSIGDASLIGKEIADLMQKNIPVERFKTIIKGAKDYLKVAKGLNGELISGFNPIVYSVILNLSKK